MLVDGKSSWALSTGRRGAVGRYVGWQKRSPVQMDEALREDIGDVLG